MKITDRSGEELESLHEVIEILKSIRGRNKIALIGNGGSAAIASHYAQDFTKCAGLRAINFNDPALLTMLGNDFSFEDTFARAVEMYTDPNDVLIAISGSGNSPNILNAVTAARNRGLKTITLSGFSGDNKLRLLGDVNMHVPVSTYGTAESAHFVLLHSILDHVANSQFSA